MTTATVQPLPMVLVPHPHVRVDGGVLHGSPYVVGTRVLVRRLFAFYKSGASIEQIVRRYPQLGPAKVFDALAFAIDNEDVITADFIREENLVGNARPSEKDSRPSPSSLLNVNNSSSGELAPGGDVSAAGAGGLNSQPSTGDSNAS